MTGMSIFYFMVNICRAGMTDTFLNIQRINMRNSQEKYENQKKKLLITVW